MNLSKLREAVKDREVWCAAVHRVTTSRTQLSDWTTTCTCELTWYTSHINTTNKQDLEHRLCWLSKINDCVPDIHRNYQRIIHAPPPPQPPPILPSHKKKSIENEPGLMRLVVIYWVSTGHASYTSWRWIQFFQECKEKCIHEKNSQMPQARVRKKDSSVPPGRTWNLVWGRWPALQMPLFAVSDSLFSHSISWAKGSKRNFSKPVTLSDNTP